MRDRNSGQKKQRGRPPSGAALSAAERMRRMRQRRKAAGLKSVVSWVPDKPAPRAPYSPHRLLEARSLAMHALIAEKIRRDPALLNRAKANLDRWRKRSDEAPRWLDEWTRILERPLPEIAALITDLSETATRLRQSSPFAGVLTPKERSRIYEAFRP